MTHDELLEEIDFLPLAGLHKWFQPALRAVVELHKPFPNLVKGYAEGCEECSSRTNATVVFYPCPTIQAIEKELA